MKPGKRVRRRELKAGSLVSFIDFKPQFDFHQIANEGPFRAINMYRVGYFFEDFTYICMHREFTMSVMNVASSNNTYFRHLKMVEQTTAPTVEDEKSRALGAYRRKLIEYREVEERLKQLRKKVSSYGAKEEMWNTDFEIEVQKEHDKSENDIKSLQSVGQIVGEVLKQLTEEKFIVKATNGPRYVVGCRRSINKGALKQGTRVALDMTTLTIMRQLPREVDPLVYKMSHEDPGNISYSEVGGLSEQIRELREVVELPLINPDLFRRVGITPPKGCLLYGPPGTGKTLLARAVASQLDCNFLKVVSSAIVDKYIGESARMIREMFNYARDHQPCIVFMDEIDAIGGRRFSEGTSADREIQRTLMELLNQMDGFDSLGRVKIIMATNRPDTLDPALLRPGRLDRKIEIGLPNEQSRLEVLKIHASKITKHGDIDYEAIVKLSDGFSGADLRNVCTEAGLFAIRAEREYVIDEDFMKAVRKVGDAKKLETKLDYKPV
ncbi:26S protease regulatory subunit 10B [Dirofilaria immitis]|nr:26S protease regulatory subunit 10B [Dirofilaria immitis]